ncbi:hypothetical protein MMC30_002323 [Trapelia coarctata]|nr:hypothetical protein [Trapelia coarctata]
MAAMNSEVLLQEVIKGLATSNLNGPHPAMIQAPVPPFLRLPAELRLQIYELVLARGFCLSHPQSTRKKRRRPPRKCNPVALLQVNRQIYLETRLLPFKLNTFTLHNPFRVGLVCHRKFSCIDYFEDLLQPLQDWQRCGIRQLELGITMKEMYKLTSYELNHAALRGPARTGGFFSKEERPYICQVLDVCKTNDPSVEKIGHWIAARLWIMGMTSLETISIAGTDIRLKKEQVLLLIVPRPRRNVYLQ